MLSVINPSAIGGFSRPNTTALQSASDYNVYSANFAGYEFKSNSNRSSKSSSGSSSPELYLNMGSSKVLDYHSNFSQPSYRKQTATRSMFQTNPWMFQQPTYNTTSTTSCCAPPKGFNQYNPDQARKGGLRPAPAPAKDYTKPLFVDCSIEYELPNAPKIPKNSEPILMIHPAYKKTDKVAHQPLTPPQEQRKILSATRRSPDSKKLSPGFSAVENCSGLVNRQSDDVRKLHAYHQHQMYLQQQQFQFQQHQQSLQKSAALELRRRMSLGHPKKVIPYQPKSTVPPQYCVSLNCQCYQAVNYRRRLLQSNLQPPMMSKPVMAPQQLHHQPHLAPASCQVAVNRKRSYTEAMVPLDPGYLYHKTVAAAAAAQQHFAQQQLYPPFKQTRFSLY